MARVRHRFLAVVMVLIAVAAAGCAKKIPVPTASTVPPPAAPRATGPASALPPPSPPRPVPPPAPIVSPVTRLTDEEVFARKTVEELNAEQVLADAFFDVDKAEIREDAKEPLQRDAEWLLRWPTTKVVVEGYCDERGSAEYNLALGTRRADAVKGYLVSLGVADERITIVSKGKEQPFCTEQNENCWQLNRRGRVIVTEK
jgi:peptidoglycan-associated lipoprotein